MPERDDRRPSIRNVNQGCRRISDMNQSRGITDMHRRNVNNSRTQPHKVEKPVLHDYDAPIGAKVGDQKQDKQDDRQEDTFKDFNFDF